MHLKAGLHDTELSQRQPGVICLLYRDYKYNGRIVVSLSTPQKHE